MCSISMFKPVNLLGKYICITTECKRLSFLTGKFIYCRLAYTLYRISPVFYMTGVSFYLGVGVLIPEICKRC